MATADLSGTVSTTTRHVEAADRPGRFDPATEARLERLDHEATAHVEANRPERTRTGYATGRPGSGSAPTPTCLVDEQEQRVLASWPEAATQPAPSGLFN